MEEQNTPDLLRPDPIMAAMMRQLASIDLEQLAPEAPPPSPVLATTPDTAIERSDPSMDVITQQLDGLDIEKPPVQEVRSRLTSRRFPELAPKYAAIRRHQMARAEERRLKMDKEKDAGEWRPYWILRGRRKEARREWWILRRRWKERVRKEEDEKRAGGEGGAERAAPDWNALFRSSLGLDRSDEGAVEGGKEDADMEGAEGDNQAASEEGVSAIFEAKDERRSVLDVEYFGP